MPYKDPEVRLAKAREYNQRWRARHPEWRENRKALPSYAQPGRRPTDEAAVAHEAVKRAIKRGVLVRPDQCEECGGSGPIEAAHQDYQQRLDVRWLCRKCHRIHDSAQPNKGTTTEPRKGRKILTADERRAYRRAWERANRLKKKAAATT